MTFLSPFLFIINVTKITYLFVKQKQRNIPQHTILIFLLCAQVNHAYTHLLFQIFFPKIYNRKNTTGHSTPPNKQAT